MASHVTERVARLAAEHQPGHCLAQPFYTDPEVFDVDMDRIFRRHWILTGHVSQIPEPGDYFLYEIGGESIIVVRDKHNEIHALYNVCTHRGSRICVEPQGRAGALVCPYHAWAFDHNGELRGARGMPDDFDRGCFSLRRCSVRIVHGMIFVFLGSDAPPELDHVWRDVSPYLKQHGLAEAKICHRTQWTIGANWKLVVENFAECYHCGPAHPEYCSVMVQAISGSGIQKHIDEFERQSQEWREHWSSKGHFTGSIEPTEHALHCATRMPIGKDGLSQSEGGKSVAPTMGEFTVNDGGVTAVRVHPGGYMIACCDYAIVNRFTPLSVDQTLQEIVWLVHPDAQEGVDYDVDKVTWLWKVTTDEDQRLLESQQRGVKSAAYRPGPYSNAETGVDKFVTWYLRQLVDSRQTSLNVSLHRPHKTKFGVQSL